MQLYFANKFTKEIQLQLPVPIETRLFSQLSAVLVEDKLTKMTPGQLLSAFRMFDNDDVKDRLMLVTIKALKAIQLDLRHFDAEQLTALILLVCKHSPHDLGTFYKFLEQAAVVKQFEGKFDSLAVLFNLFVEQGFMEPETPFYFMTHLAMKDAFLGDGISNDRIIDLTWCLIAMEQGASISNPLVAKAIQQLSFFKRETPLTHLELVKLY